jgi:hypothetical protein
MKTVDVESDIKNALSFYPDLKMESKEGALFLKGEIELLHPESKLFIDSFSVEIEFTADFPRRFPKVREVGGKIPHDLDRHVNVANGNILCLSPEPEEIIRCKNGITTKWFLDEVLNPRLGEEYLVNHGGKYLREYPHGYNGSWKFYMNEINSNDPAFILLFLEMTLRKGFPKGYKTCPCGSGKKFKNCHQSSYFKLSMLGDRYLNWQIEKLKLHPYDLKSA